MHSMDSLPDCAKPERLRRYQRVLKGSQFRVVFAGGKRVGHPKLRLVICPNGLEWSRLGLAVSRGVSKKAVVRNRLKRQIREIFRRAGDHIPQSLDVVVIPQPSVLDLSFQELKALLYQQVAIYCERAKRAQQGSRRPQIKPGDKPKSARTHQPAETPNKDV